MPLGVLLVVHSVDKAESRPVRMDSSYICTK